MTVSITQESFVGILATDVTISLTLIGVATGASLHVIGLSNDGLHVQSLADNRGNPVTQRGADITAGSIRLSHWTLENVVGGDTIYTMTMSSSRTSRFLAVREIGGCRSASVDGFNQVSQATPGTGADGVTVNASNSSQPALISAFAIRCFFNTTLVAGTGYTSAQGQNTGDGSIGAWRCEHKRVTDTPANHTATFTVGSDGNVISCMSYFLETVALPIGQIIT